MADHKCPKCGGWEMRQRGTRWECMYLSCGHTWEQGKTALDVQADGRAATVETSDARIVGDRFDIIRALRQDLAVIEGGTLQGNGLMLRGAEFAGRAVRLSKLIDQQEAGVWPRRPTT